jgi:integrase
VSLIAEGRYLDVKKEYNTTLKELLKKYEENFGNQPSYKSAKRHFVKSIKEYFGEDTLLSNIRYVNLETYRNHLKKKLTKHGTVRKSGSVNREMSCFRHMMKKAVSWDMMDKNPFECGDSLILKENNRRLRFLSEVEIAKLLDKCRGHLRDIVECAIHTGMRKGEILNLKWSQVKNGLIYLTKTKTSNPREIPVNDTLELIFNRRKRQFKLRLADGKKQNTDYIFTFNGEPVMDVKTAFRIACDNAGIEDFRFHDLRHTFASQLILKGGTLKDVQELLGHKTMTMTLRYAHLTQEHKRKAVNLLSSLPAPKPAEKPACHKSVTKTKPKAKALG